MKFVILDFPLKRRVSLCSEGGVSEFWVGIGNVRILVLDSPEFTISLINTE